MVAGVVAERDSAVKAVEKDAAPQLSAADSALAANNSTFVSEVLNASALDSLASQAPAGSVLQAKIVKASKNLKNLMPRTPRLRENALLQSLGLERSYLTGDDVGVAVIDSGIDNSGARFTIVGRYDFTATGRHRELERRVRPRHPRGRPDRRQRHRHRRREPRRGAGRPLHRPQGPRPLRRRLHERRRAGGRVRHRQPHAPRHRHHQPLARSSDLRAGRQRSAGARRRESRRRGHRRRGLGRQLRPQSGDRRGRLRGCDVARQRALGDHGRGAQHEGHGDPERRRSGEVQLARTDVVRRLRQARRRRSRQPARLRHGEEQHAVHPAPRQPDCREFAGSRTS